MKKEIRRIKPSTSLAIGIMVVGLLAGCASTSTGTKLDPAKVALIKKGVTTRTEVESLLGPPTNVSIVGDGRRMMFYTFHAPPTFEAGATDVAGSMALHDVMDFHALSDRVMLYDTLTLNHVWTLLGQSGRFHQAPESISQEKDPP